VFKPTITTNFHRKKFKRNKTNLQKQLDSLTLTLAAHGNSKKNGNSLHWVDVRMRFQNTAKERERYVHMCDLQIDLHILAHTDCGYANHHHTYKLQKNKKTKKKRKV
jgi:hypothetical protein